MQLPGDDEELEFELLEIESFVFTRARARSPKYHV